MPDRERVPGAPDPVRAAGPAPRPGAVAPDGAPATSAHGAARGPGHGPAQGPAHSPGHGHGPAQGPAHSIGRGPGPGHGHGPGHEHGHETLHGPSGAGHDGPAGEAGHRPPAARWAAYTEEVQRLVDATYRVVERTGSLDPTVRDILREAGLSNQAFYRHFRSKDELLVALLDDGRRRMAGHLRRRMAGAADPRGKVRAWIEGLLAQAADPVAAARTRPFLAHQDRLAELYADEQRAGVDAMLRPLEEVLERTPSSKGHAREDALAVYRLTLACLHDHLRARTSPAPEEVAHVVRFATAGLGLA